MSLDRHVLDALPPSPGAELLEVLAAVRRAVPGVTEAEVVEALGRLATGRGPTSGRAWCRTDKDERGRWRTQWHRVPA